MIPALIILLIVALFLVVCFRHFFVQLVGLKLLLDAMTILLVNTRNPDTSSTGPQAAAVLISSLSALVFFVLMAAGIQRFARAKGASLEVKGD